MQNFSEWQNFEKLMVESYEDCVVFNNDGITQALR